MLATFNPKLVPVTRQKPHPKFVMQVMEDMRSLMGANTIFRVKMDSSAKKTVGFSAQWLGGGRTDSHNIERRAFLENEKTQEGKYCVIFMAKMFDEDAVVIEYNDATFPYIAKDIQTYLRDGALPD